MKLYEITVTKTPKHLEACGCIGLKIKYEFYANTPEEAKRLCKQFDYKARILNIREV